MARRMGRLRQALVSDVNAPTVWPAAAVALISLLVGAAIALAVGLAGASLAAGFVAAFGVIAGSLVPPGWTTQVAVPAVISVAVAPSLALLGQGRPVAAGFIAAAVFAISALAMQDVPSGAIAGALGATAYVLTVGMVLVRDVPLVDTLLAGAIGLVTAALATVVSRAVRGWLVHRGRVSATSVAPPLPGRFLTRLVAGIGAALRDWRRNSLVRLALRRVLVLAPLVAVLEWWRNPVALYALIVAFSVTQPTAADTLTRALARTAGTITAIVVTIALVVVLPPPMVVAFAVLAMVAGLAYVLRSPFLTTLGTTVLTVAAGALAGTSIPAANRLLSTIVGAVVGLLATVLIPVPRSTDHPTGGPPSGP